MALFDLQGKDCALRVGAPTFRRAARCQAANAGGAPLDFRELRSSEAELRRHGRRCVSTYVEHVGAYWQSKARSLSDLA